MKVFKAALACLVTVAVGSVVTTALAGGNSQRPTAGRVLQAEVKAMEANGMSPGDPKLKMLREDLARLNRRREANTSSVDLSDTLGPRGGGPANVEGRTNRPVVWDLGVVECEAVPSLLTAEDIRGAQCVSAPQPDGSTLYTATAPDGTSRTVRFGLDGTVTREADR